MKSSRLHYKQNICNKEVLGDDHFWVYVSSLTKHVLGTRLNYQGLYDNALGYLDYVSYRKPSVISCLYVDAVGF